VDIHENIHGYIHGYISMDGLPIACKM